MVEKRFGEKYRRPNAPRKKEKKHINRDRVTKKQGKRGTYQAPPGKCCATIPTIRDPRKTENQKKTTKKNQKRKK